MSIFHLPSKGQVAYCVPKKNPPLSDSLGTLNFAVYFGTTNRFNKYSSTSSKSKLKTLLTITSFGLITK